MFNKQDLQHKVKDLVQKLGLEQFRISSDPVYHSSLYENLKDVYAIECTLGEKKGIEGYLIIAKISTIEGSGIDADAWMKNLSDLYFGWDAETGGVVKEKDMYYVKNRGWLWAVSSKALYRAKPSQITQLINNLTHDLIQLSFEETE